MKKNLLSLLLSLSASAALTQYSIDGFKVAGGGATRTGGVYSVKRHHRPVGCGQRDFPKLHITASTLMTADSPAAMVLPLMIARSQRTGSPPISTVAVRQDPN